MISKADLARIGRMERDIADLRVQLSKTVQDLQQLADNLAQQASRQEPVKIAKGK